jgi:hypothetical protein
MPNAKIQPRTSSHSQIWSLPPKRIVKAIVDYTARNAHELSFETGDFFYVINEPSDKQFEVINPVLRIRGIVPQNRFEKDAKPVVKDVLKSIHVHNAEQNEAGVWIFTVEFKYESHSLIIKRSPDDFSILHIGLLNHFPAESGRANQSRIIPFLRKVTCQTKQDSIILKKVLHNYLNEFLDLPEDIFTSSQFMRFQKV